MKQIYTNAVKLVMLLALVLCAGKANAENVISIDPLTFESYDVVDVPVVLTNTPDDHLQAFELKVVLPDMLEFAGTPTKNSDRLLSSHSLNFEPTTGKLMIVSIVGKEIVGNEGVVLTIPVKVKDYMLNDATAEIAVTGITFTSEDGDAEYYQPDFTVPVTVTAPAYSFSVYFEPADAVVNPGATHTLAVGINNDGPIAGFQLDVEVPAGITVDTESAEWTARCSSNAIMTANTMANGKTRFTMVDLTTNLSISTDTNTGVVFTFAVNVDAEYAAETDVVTISNVIISPAGGERATIDGCTLTLTNGITAYNAATAVVSDLQASLLAAMDVITEECPLVAEEYSAKAAEYAAAINELQVAIAAAYADGTLTPNYDAVVAPAAEIAEGIAALVEEARAAEAAAEEAQAEADRVAANQAAYDAVKQQIADLQTKLDVAAATVAEQYPDIDMSAEIAAAQEAIDALNAEADAAFEAVAEEGEYAYTVDTTELEAQIDAIVTTAAEKALTSGIYGITVGEVEGIEGIYTLEGVRLAAPRAGSVNVLVTKTGEAKKIFVR